LSSNNFRPRHLFPCNELISQRTTDAAPPPVFSLAWWPFVTRHFACQTADALFTAVRKPWEDSPLFFPSSHILFTFQVGPTISRFTSSTLEIAPRPQHRRGMYHFSIHRFLGTSLLVESLWEMPFYLRTHLQAYQMPLNPTSAFPSKFNEFLNCLSELPLINTNNSNISSSAIRKHSQLHAQP
jgi:hypothetical protein